MSSSREEWIEGDFLAVVIDTHDQVEAATNDLASAGVSRDAVRVFQGKKGQEELGNIGGQGLVAQIKRVLEDYVGAAKDMTDRHKEEAAAGHYVVIVPLPDSHLADKIDQVLKSHGAHDVGARIGGTYEMR
jgi:hypothetical protein